MRILFFSAHYPPYGGGGEVMGERLVEMLAERGHDIVVVTCHGARGLPDVERRGRIEIRRFRFWDAVARSSPGDLARSKRELSALKRSFAPDLVHLNTISPVDPVHWLSRPARPVPTLVTLQGSFPDALCRPLRPGTVFDRAFRAADGLVACSASVIAELQEICPGAAARCHLVYNGANLPDLEPGAPPSGPPRILCVGRLVPEKGFETAVRAFAMLRESVPAAELWLVGEGPERQSLEAMAREAGLGREVHFWGRLKPDRVWRLLEQSRVVFVPSRREAFGLVALEAALAGRPVVASSTNGLREVVVDGLTGCLVPPGDPSAMAAAAVPLMLNPALAARMGSVARRRARALFGAERCADAYDDLYDKMLAAGANS